MGKAIQLAEKTSLTDRFQNPRIPWRTVPCRGPLGEIAGFDRALSPAEITALEIP